MSRNLTKTPAFKLELFLEHPNLKNLLFLMASKNNVLGETSACIKLRLIRNLRFLTAIEDSHPRGLSRSGASFF
ncbi:hypothetical protein FJZ18_03740 [Candidatus Pacearchaeota archaeon]|nr:hypothetical protein [Candidatus Pacearchaeota archaeon]